MALLVLQRKRRIGTRTDAFSWISSIFHGFYVDTPPRGGAALLLYTKRLFYIRAFIHRNRIEMVPGGMFSIVISVERPTHGVLSSSQEKGRVSVQERPG